jgi:dethiobiotin synthetase
MPNPSSFVVAGIGTDVGKTFVSAVLVAGLEAAYWKPIQSGTVPQTDTEWLQTTLQLPPERIFPEAYRLAAPESPHSSAAKEGITINPDSIQVPETDRTLIIEGAGGVMVPLNDDTLYIDLLRQWCIPVVLVVDTYLGCINHALLTVEALTLRTIPIQGIIFNRAGKQMGQQFIAQYTDVPILGHLPTIESMTPQQFNQLFHENISWETVPTH